LGLIPISVVFSLPNFDFFPLIAVEMEKMSLAGISYGGGEDGALLLWIWRMGSAMAAEKTLFVLGNFCNF